MVPDIDDAVALVGPTRGSVPSPSTGDLIGPTGRWAGGRRPVEPGRQGARGGGGRALRSASSAPQRSPTSSRTREAARARSADVEAALAARQAADRGRSAVAAELAELGRPHGPPPPRPNATSPRPAGGAALEKAQLALPGSSSGWPTPRPPRRGGAVSRDRDRLRAEVAAARQGETEARLAVRTAEERARALHGRAESLRRQARQERAARERAAAARVARERGARWPRRAADAERRSRRWGRPSPCRGAERDALASRSSSEAELLEVRARGRSDTPSSTG